MIFIGDDEKRLIKRLHDGDKAAVKEFHSLYAEYLAGVCSRYIADEEDLKDVFQDSLVHILTHIGEFKYRGAGSLQAWVTKVAVNESLKFLRTQERHGQVQIDYIVSDDPEEDDDPPLADIPPDVIQEMLDRLPTGYRTVMNLYVFEDKSHQEIARLLGIGKSSSASQLHRARILLVKMIKEYYDNKPPRQ